MFNVFKVNNLLYQNQMAISEKNILLCQFF